MAKKKDELKYSKGLAGAALGASAGTLYTFNKDSLPEGRKKVQLSAVDKYKFVSKLEPGDVLLSGAYKTGPWEKGFDALLRRNHPAYHSGVYLGKGEFGEILLVDHAKPSRSNIHKDLSYALTHDAHQAYRPKLTPKERINFIKTVKKSIATTKYDSAAATKAYVARAVGITHMPCEGNYCSNVIAKALPKRMFNVGRDTVFSADFIKSKHFKLVAESRKINTHLPASNSSILKYVAAPAIALGALGFISDNAKKR